MMVDLPASYCLRRVRCFLSFSCRCVLILSHLSLPHLATKLSAMTPATPSEPSGSWDSIHVFETTERGRQAHYKLTSTIMLQLITHRGGDSEEERSGGRGDGWKREGEVNLSGSMTRQVSVYGRQSFGIDFLTGDPLSIMRLSKIGLSKTLHPISRTQAG